MSILNVPGRQNPFSLFAQSANEPKTNKKISLYLFCGLCYDNNQIVSAYRKGGNLFGNDERRSCLSASRRRHRIPGTE